MAANRALGFDGAFLEEDLVPLTEVLLGGGCQLVGVHLVEWALLQRAVAAWPQRWRYRS